MSLKTIEQRREALQGYIYSPFRMNNLFNAILQQEDALSDVCVYDGYTIEPATLMYRSASITTRNSSAISSEPTPLFQLTLTMNFGGHAWTLLIDSTPVFEASIDKTAPQIILFADILISLLLFVLVWQVRGRMLQKLSNVQRQHQLILESAGEGIYGVNLQGNCTFINPAAERMLQWQLHEILNKPAHALMHHSKKNGTVYPREECPMYAAFTDGKIHIVDDEVFWRKNGELFPVEDTSTLIRDTSNRITGAVVTFRDISKRLHAEAMLAKQTAELKRSDEELQQFAYVASHDLQEPLRKIQAFGDRLKTKEAQLLSDTGRDYIERMQNTATRIRSLINDLLSYSRITTSVRPFRAVNLNNIAQEVICDLEVQLEQSQGWIEIENLPIVQANPLQMRQLFQNLIGNALKFSKLDEPPLVKVYNGSKSTNTGVSNGHCQAYIEDNGIGFENKYRNRIFTPFQRLHGRDAYEGTGIGLAICHKIVERHGGYISAESIPGVVREPYSR